MRVLVLNWLDLANPDAGGAELHLQETFGRIVAAGHEVTLVCSGWTGCEERAHVDGIDIHRVGGRYSFLLAGPRRARRLLSASRYDLVVEDLNKVPLFAPLWTRVPIVVLVHHLFGSTAVREAGLAVGGATRLFEVPISRVFRKCPMIAVSESTAEDLVKRGVAPNRITVIKNGVDTDFYRVSPAERAPEPTVLYLGRFKRYKRPDLVLEGFAELVSGGRSARLVMAGDGGERDALQRRSRELGIQDQVEFPGSVSEAQKRELFQRAWIHVIASEKEGWGLTVVEAGACATPSVVSDSPGLRESVRDGITGILVPHGDVAALAESMELLLSDEAMRVAMGKQARSWAESLSWERTAEATLQLLESTLERSHSHG